MDWLLGPPPMMSADPQKLANNPSLPSWQMVRTMTEQENVARLVAQWRYYQNAERGPEPSLEVMSERLRNLGERIDAARDRAGLG